MVTPLVSVAIISVVGRTLSVRICISQTPDDPRQPSSPDWISMGWSWSHVYAPNPSSRALVTRMSALGIGIFNGGESTYQSWENKSFSGVSIVDRPSRRCGGSRYFVPSSAERCTDGRCIAGPTPVSIPRSNLQCGAHRRPSTCLPPILSSLVMRNWACRRRKRGYHLSSVTAFEHWNLAWDDK